MNTLGGTKRKGATVGIGILAMFPMLGWAPSAVAQDAFAGECDMTLEVTYSPPLKLTVPTTATTVTVDGDGTCITTHGTVDATLEASGTAPVTATFTCAGGAVVGTGTFDLVGVDDYPTGRTGPAVITLTGKAGTVTIESVDLTVTASGAFEQDLPSAADCNMGGVAGAEWNGVVVFAATSDLQTGPPTTDSVSSR